MILRNIYTESKTAESVEERENARKILFDFLKKRQYNYKKRVNSSQLGYGRCEKLVMECSK
jgi:hypothetical protein